MPSVSSVRIPGLATGMDTDTMIKEMLKGEQGKVDKAKQKEQTIKWQQEIYREIIKDTKGFEDKYFSLTSKDSLLSSNSWSTVSVASSNSNVLTAKGNYGAPNVDYKFEVNHLAEPAKIHMDISNKESVESDVETFLGKHFKISVGDNMKSKTITVESGDTVDSLMKKINESMPGEIKASYSEMTGEFTIETKKTGENATLKIIDVTVNPDKSETEGHEVFEDKGVNSEIVVKSRDGNTKIKTINAETNSFTIDAVEYNIYTTGSAEITSKQDTQPLVDNMKAFIEDYNKIMDKVYDLLTEKKKADYPPLTEAQKEDMSEEEIERWEKKAKEGILRNDSEMRRFMDDMQKSIFGDKMSVLNEMGLTSHDDYNKKGQIALDEKKFIKALENDSDKVYQIFAKGNSSVLESMKTTIKDYIGGSSSIFARKAGLEKTASVVKNFYSEQLKRQEESIKKLQRKMNERESQLYKQFANLEASMNKLNSQMSYFSQM